MSGRVRYEETSLGSNSSYPKLPSNENGDYETKKMSTFKLQLLYLLRGVRLVEKRYNPYLSYH